MFIISKLIKNIIKCEFWYLWLKNYFKCAAFDAELDDANDILKDNNIFLTDTFYDKCSEGQLGCFLSHFQLWKYIIKSNLDLAIILEDDVKIYNNFNKIIDMYQT